MIKNFFCISFLILSFSAHAAKKLIKEGPWRFEMRATYGTIPFVIDFKYEGNALTGTLRNGKESIPLKDIHIKKDVIKIPLQHYENGLELTVLNDQSVTGDFVRYNKKPESRTPLEGKHGSKDRFNGKWETPRHNLSGKWSVSLKEEDGKETQGVVLLQQNGNKLNGTIMSPTGDYRYFEGYVSGELFEAASFDGVYNYLFINCPTILVLATSLAGLHYRNTQRCPGGL